MYPQPEQPPLAIKVVNQRRVSTDVMIGALAANVVTVVVLIILGAISI